MGEKKSKDEAASGRSSDRVPLKAMVTYRMGGQEYGNLAADVSPHGIFLRTFMPPPVGTDLDLTLEIPDEGGSLRVHLRGKVARVVDGADPRKNGMGVNFTSLHTGEPRTVHRLMAFLVELMETGRPQE